jgi:lipopolysaccharide/colanic/teichoic acid biosynthesis glycosyltransferase
MNLEASTLVMPDTPGRSIQRALKRGFDPVLAAFLFVLLSPLYFLIWLGIRLDSPGPAIFVQERWGLDTRPFRMYKFRTLRHNAPDPSQKYEMVESDPRVTRIGAFLRKTSLDELPQLLNVILGNMSLVGPRPLVEWESRECLERHSERFLVLPGITGLSQVYARNAVDLSARSDLDVEYVRRWTLLLDVKILLISPFKVAATDGIYPQGSSPEKR